ncbi:hypothetical protein QCA50_010836 [Cerrena zonata]|uniref:Uncharacterized protein n=1 Tax=Cerrena zonata TaxID=2478898 RepID=A0AAW0FXT2_9APHY
MSASDIDSDSFSEIEPFDLDDDVIALLEGRASSQATHPTTSSEFDASECDARQPSLKQEPSSPCLDPSVDDEGFPLMTLTQEESAVLDALEEDFQLSQTSRVVKESDDFNSQPLTQLRGKRQRPLSLGRSLTQPCHSSSLSSSTSEMSFVANRNVPRTVTSAKSMTNILRSSELQNITSRRKPVRAEPEGDTGMQPYGEDERQQVVAELTNAADPTPGERVAKRRKLNTISRSKTQPSTKFVPGVQMPPPRSYSISAMVSLWDDVDPIEPEVIEISSDSDSEQEAPEKPSDPKAVPYFTAPAALAVRYSQTPRIDQFFSQYPEFDYKPNAPAVGEFMRLTQQKGWKNGEATKKEVQAQFKTVMSEQFNEIYGLDPNDVKAWQYMLQVLDIDPIPQDLDECRRVIRSLYVNLVDLVDLHRAQETPQKFEDLAALRAYTRGHKIFPLKVAKAGGVLKFLLRKIHN